ncbi:MAG TPA: hypothetical protein VEK74_09555 [Burkholderiaceae bacterium]|nr:hypothetical protein [Burkholderiaceae bacterium]
MRERLLERFSLRAVAKSRRDEEAFSALAFSRRVKHLHNLAIGKPASSIRKIVTEANLRLPSWVFAQSDAEVSRKISRQ